MSQWEVFAALPNITLPDSSTGHIELSAEVRDLAIVRADDLRVVDARHQSPAVDQLLSGFRTHDDRAYLPAVMLVRSTAPSTVAGPALTSFRNAIALSVILRSWATMSANDEPLFSDSFDIFPAYATNSGHLLKATAATRTLYAMGTKFLATPSPIGRLRPNYLVQDYYIARALAECWCRCYQDGRDDRFSRSLFRSLEISYAAASAPMRHNATEYEWGINLALWVSAVEVLAHPHAHGKSGGVNQEKALQLIGSYTWGSKKLDDKRRTIWPRGKTKPSMSVNPIQSAYHYLYKARNTYLHGNKVLKWTMRPFRRSRTTTLVMLAPLIYRTALFAYLQRKVRPYHLLTDSQWNRPKAAPHRMVMVAERMRINEALNRMLWPSASDLAP